MTIPLSPMNKVRERDRDLRRKRREKSREDREEGCSETEDGGEGRNVKKTKRDQGGWKASRTVPRGLFAIVRYRERDEGGKVEGALLGRYTPRRTPASGVHVIAHSTLWLGRNRIATVP